MFGVINEAEVDIFLELLCFLHDPMNVGNLISDSSVSSKPSLYIWKFSVDKLLKHSLKDIENNLRKHVKLEELYGSLNILLHCSLRLE